MDESCDCSVCIMTQEYHRFAALLPESERSSFKDWYSLIFDELESLTTAKEFEEYSKHKKEENQNESC